MLRRKQSGRGLSLGTDAKHRKQEHHHTEAATMPGRLVDMHARL